jgi:hypothetical protein
MVKGVYLTTGGRHRNHDRGAIQCVGKGSVCCGAGR